MAREQQEEDIIREAATLIGFNGPAYGRAMQICNKLWRELAVAMGHPGSEFVIGSCAAFMVPCQCAAEAEPVLDHNGHCEWCCGTRQVTERVRAAQVAAKEGK